MSDPDAVGLAELVAEYEDLLAEFKRMAWIEPVSEDARTDPLTGLERKREVVRQQIEVVKRLVDDAQVEVEGQGW